MKHSYLNQTWDFGKYFLKTSASLPDINMLLKIKRQSGRKADPYGFYNELRPGYAVK